MGFPEFPFQSELEGQTVVGKLGHIVRKAFIHFAAELGGFLSRAGFTADGHFTDLRTETITFVDAGGNPSPSPIGNDGNLLYNKAGVIAGANHAFWDDAQSQLIVSQTVTGYNTVSLSTFGSSTYTHVMFGAEISPSGGILPENASAGLVTYNADGNSAGNPVMEFASIYRGMTPGADQSFPSFAARMYLGGTVAGNYKNGIAVLERAGATGAEPGAILIILRNGSGNFAAGAIAVQAKDGTTYYVWPDANGYLEIGTAPPEEDGTPSDTSGAIIPKIDTGGVLKTGRTMADGSAAAIGTLTNAPAAGNPTKWIQIDDNGTTRYIPAW